MPRIRPASRQFKYRKQFNLVGDQSILLNAVHKLPSSSLPAIEGAANGSVPQHRGAARGPGDRAGARGREAGARGWFRLQHPGLLGCFPAPPRGTHLCSVARCRESSSALVGGLVGAAFCRQALQAVETPCAPSGNAGRWEHEEKENGRSSVFGDIFKNSFSLCQKYKCT